MNAKQSSQAPPPPKPWPWSWATWICCGRWRWVIPCAVVSRPGVPTLYSRYAQSRLAWDDYEVDTDRLVDSLVRFGSEQPSPPVLFYEEDGQVLLISRYRERLAQAFRFVVADATLRKSPRQVAVPVVGGAP